MENQASEEKNQQKDQKQEESSSNQTAEDKNQHNDQNQEEPNSNHVVLSSDDDQKTPYNDKQMVLFDPTTTNQTPDSRWDSDLGPQRERVLPSVGAFTVQCALCFKWRFIPTKEKYEEIREHIMEQPFTCDLAKEWRADANCDAPGDIEQDNTRLWAIDKPSIAQPPPGWERELRIRGEGSSRFADVYYISPFGKKLRSMVEIQKYLVEHPEFISQGVTLSQFSFQIPKPLQEDYVRKRTPRLTVPGDSNFGVPSSPQTIEASPLSWVAPTDSTNLQLARTDDVTPPVKKKARSSTKDTHKSSPLQHNPHNFNLAPNGVYEL